jgi:hypothetical protein
MLQMNVMCVCVCGLKDSEQSSTNDLWSNDWMDWKICRNEMYGIFCLPSYHITNLHIYYVETSLDPS